MSSQFPSRRAFLLGAATGLAGLGFGSLPAHAAANARARTGTRTPQKKSSGLAIQQLSTDVLDIGYHAAGPENGRPVVLVHDFGYDIHSFVDVAPRLAAAGYRVLVPHLRGHGSTRFKDAATPRSAQQAALGKDLIDFIDAMHFPEAVFAGIGWGAHAAYAATVVRPTRCIGVVLSGNGRADEASLWHQHYFQSEAGKAELQANRRDIARTLWKRNSPASKFDEERFARAAASFDNPDYVDILVHAYRHRHAGAAGDPQYDTLEKRFAAKPAVAVPAITLAGAASGVAPATDALQFTAAHSHRDLPGVGHDVAQEAAQAFADAAAELVRTGKWRT
jgi:pimeloyl-ACP methyl ester carboxylesterase